MRHRQLDRWASAPLTYGERGATQGPLPDGYRHVRRDIAIGAGDAAFRRAATALCDWRMHRTAGLAVQASTPHATPDALLLLGVGWGPVRLTAPCRVVYTVTDADRVGFAYGTLPGHPECGEEVFLVYRRPDGEVRFEIRAFSRPATLLARAGGPLSRMVQDLITDRYAAALRLLARG